MFCNVIAYRDDIRKTVKTNPFWGVRYHSFRFGDSVMNINEALRAVRWAHRRGYNTEVIIIG